MPLLKLTKITPINNYYSFTFESFSVHFGTCIFENMSRYIYNFLSDMGTKRSRSEVRDFIPFRLDGKEIIINLSLIHCDKAISQNFYSKDCDIVLRKMYYTFKTNHYLTFNYLMLRAINKQTKIELDGSDLVYPEIINILIPKGERSERFDPRFEYVSWYVNNLPIDFDSGGYVLNKFADREEPDFLLPEDARFVLRKLYPSGKVFQDLII